MLNLKKTLTIAITIIALLSVTSCGFRPRHVKDLPPQLHTLSIDSNKPYSNLLTQLKAMLRSLNVTLVNTHSKAPYTLHLSNINFSQSNRPIRTTTLAVTLTYTLTVDVSMTSQHGKTIISTKTLHASRSISQNPSQVYTPGTATLVKQALRRDIASKIYYLLTANNTRNKLNYVH